MMEELNNSRKRSVGSPLGQSGGRAVQTGKREMEAFRECPQYAGCSAPLCPLDSDMRERFALPDEPECGALRKTREAIAARYADLPTGGLTDREIVRDRLSAARKERWAALPAEVRAEHLARLEAARVARQGSKGVSPDSV
jgi:hypothetical protein